MIDIVIATVLSAIISYFAVMWQQPNSEVTGILNVVVVFALTFVIYFGLKRALFSSRAQTLP